MPNNNQKRETPVRGMPNNVEAEQNVLGSMLIDSDATSNLLPRLKAEDFYIEKHRDIFKAMHELNSNSLPVDAVTVADRLETEGKLDEIGSVAYLSELAESVLSSANAEYYMKILKRDSLLRRIIHTGNDIVSFAYDSSSGEEALEHAEGLFYGITDNISDRALVNADAALARVMSDIQASQLGKNQQDYVRSGFKTLDRITKGLKPGELILLAARPSVGKTAFALNVAANVALKGKCVAIFSLEMSAELLMKRVLAYVSQIAFEDMDRMGGIAAGEQNDRLMNAYRKLKSLKLYIDDYSLNSPAEILSKCRRLKHEVKSLDLVVVDYLQLMHGNSTSSRGFESRQVEVSDMSRMMKIYSKELGCPILLLSQMSRNIEGRKTEPMLSDLRESGAIEQDADVVAFLHNPSQYNASLPSDEIILYVKKNRNGPLGEITLNFDGSTTTFKEQVRGDAGAAESGAQTDRPSRESEEPVRDVRPSEPVRDVRPSEPAREVRAEEPERGSDTPEPQAQEEEDDGLRAVGDIVADMNEVTDSVDEGDLFDDDAPLDDDDLPPFDESDDDSLGF